MTRVKRLGSSLGLKAMPCRQARQLVYHQPKITRGCVTLHRRHAMATLCRCLVSLHSHAADDVPAAEACQAGTAHGDCLRCHIAAQTRLRRALARLCAFRAAMPRRGLARIQKGRRHVRCGDVVLYRQTLAGGRAHLIRQWWCTAKAAGNIVSGFLRFQYSSLTA